MSRDMRGRRRAVIGLVAAGVASSFVFTTADAAARTRTVAGIIRSEPLAGPECTSPIGFCAAGTFIGSISGPFEASVSRILDSQTPGYVFVDSTVVVHTRDGDLFLSDASAINFEPGGSGERVVLSKVMGGTGEWDGASGFLQVTGELAHEPDVPARYRGRITVP